MIRFENVHKHFSKNRVSIHALDGATFKVPPASLAVVRGPSGSGKTTLINVAAGLIRPTSGSVVVAGECLDPLAPGARAALRARRIAVVFQMFHLVPYLTALENVLLPTLAFRETGALERGRRLLAELRLERRAGHFPGELSAGERQRCALARALLNRPEVLLADEPTGNLDDDSAALVLAALDRSRADGATVLLVTHQHLDIIRPDVQLHLKDGRIQS